MVLNHYLQWILLYIYIHILCFFWCIAYGFTRLRWLNAWYFCSLWLTHIYPDNLKAFGVQVLLLFHLARRWAVVTSDIPMAMATMVTVVTMVAEYWNITRFSIYQLSLYHPKWRKQPWLAEKSPCHGSPEDQPGGLARSTFVVVFPHLCLVTGGCI